MTREEAESVIEEYSALVEKAVGILNGKGPPWGYVSNSEWARLSFDGEDAVVSHPETSSYYDSCSIDTDTERFPAALLFMSDEDLMAWKKEAQAKYDAEQRERKAVELRQREAQERAAYELLRQKYGDRS